MGELRRGAEVHHEENHLCEYGRNDDPPVAGRPPRDREG